MHYALWSVLLLLYIFCISNTAAVINCGSLWSLIDVSIENCIDDETCQWDINATVEVKYTIKADKFAAEGDIYNEVSIIRDRTRFGLYTVPYNLCDVTQCPVQINSLITYTGNVLVNLTAPLSGITELNLRTTKGDQLICFNFPVNVGGKTTTISYDVSE